MKLQTIWENTGNFEYIQNKNFLIKDLVSRVKRHATKLTRYLPYVISKELVSKMYFKKQIQFDKLKRQTKREKKPKIEIVFS